MMPDREANGRPRGPADSPGLPRRNWRPLLLHIGCNALCKQPRSTVREYGHLSDMSPNRSTRVVAVLLTVAGLRAFAQDASAFQKEALAKHNEYRALHGVPPLKLSSSLTRYAEERLNSITRSPGLSAGHAGLKAGHGENLFWSGSSTPARASAADAISSWYSEIKQYKGDFSSKSGHFTQVVWKSTTEVGCASRVLPPGGVNGKWHATYVCCIYTPAGNVQGEFSANVPRRK